MPFAVEIPEEVEWEEACRRYPCPVCQVQPPTPCHYPQENSRFGRAKSQTKILQGASRSHTGRYALAAADGLVPPHSGGHVTGYPTR